MDRFQNAKMVASPASSQAYESSGTSGSNIFYKKN